MIYGRSSPRQRSKKELIVCVGWHAHIDWLQPQSDPNRPVPLTDASGQVVANDLVDGDEVEILSWRQHSRAGVAYQIRCLRDGSEWWISASHLRRGRERVEASLGGPS